MPDLIPVRVRDCACPDTPHAEGDEVYLLPTLPMEGGLAAEQDLFAAAGDSNLLTRLWLRTFVTHGAVGWNLTDADGKPVPFEVEAITADWALARPVANRASELYADTVMAPFLKEQAARSPTGPTAATTSRPTRRTRTSSASS